MIIKCFSFFNLAIFKAAMAFKKSAWKCLRARLEISKVAFDDAKVIARLRELEANVAFIDIFSDNNDVIRDFLTKRFIT